MSWREEYVKAATAFIVRHGTPVETDPRYQSDYGYTARDYQGIMAHIRNCPVASSAIAEAHWDEFEGTFADEPWSARKGSDAVITCTCGLLTDQPFRYEGTIAEMIAGVLAESED